MLLVRLNNHKTAITGINQVMNKVMGMKWKR